MIASKNTIIVFNNNHLKCKMNQAKLLFNPLTTKMELVNNSNFVTIKQTVMNFKILLKH